MRMTTQCHEAGIIQRTIPVLWLMHLIDKELIFYGTFK